MNTAVEPRRIRSVRPEMHGLMARKEAEMHQRLADAELRAAKIAAAFAQEIGLPAGNLWEPAIARNMLRAYHEGSDWPAVEMEWAFRLGLCAAHAEPA